MGGPFGEHLGDHAGAMQRVDLSTFAALLERGYGVKC